MRSSEPILIQNVELICMKEQATSVGDLLIQDGEFRLVESDFHLKNSVRTLNGCEWSVTQGFVDLLSHGGEPGSEDKETFESLSELGLRGGFSTLCVSPETQPVNDSRSVTEWIGQRARQVGRIEILPIAAATRNLDGQRLSDLFDIKEAGVAGVQLGRGSISDSGMMRRAVEYAKGVELLVFERPLDLGLHRGGLMDEGRWSTEAGVKGSPRAAEDIAVSRAIAIAELVDTPIHVGPLSSGRSVELVRRAKNDGVKITASVNVLNLIFTSQDVRETLDSGLNVVPPLRQEEDRVALINGIKDGTIDALSSGHRRQTTAGKQEPFEWSMPGASTLDILFGLIGQLRDDKHLTLDEILRVLIAGPNSILGRRVEPLREGGRNLVIFDKERKFTLEQHDEGSRWRNRPPLVRELKGCIVGTLTQGICQLWHTE